MVEILKLMLKIKIPKLKFDQDLCATCDMNSTLGSVVPLAMFLNMTRFQLIQQTTMREVVGIKIERTRARHIIPVVTRKIAKK